MLSAGLFFVFQISVADHSSKSNDQLLGKLLRILKLPGTIETESICNVSVCVARVLMRVRCQLWACKEAAQASKTTTISVVKNLFKTDGHSFVQC